MLDQFFEITNFITNAFLHIWPYLLITIPLAVAVQVSGVSKYIDRAFSGHPLTAVLLATAVGAFSPFCSCGVIPVVAALLIGGVPLAPVMSFWIASPSMDPEAFFLSVATIGWQLAVWRLIATFVVSLSAGFITHLIVRQGWLGQSILRNQQARSAQSVWTHIKGTWQSLKRYLALSPALGFVAGGASLNTQASCGVTSGALRVDKRPVKQTATTCDTRCDSDGESAAGASCGIKPVSFRRRLLGETWRATSMVVKFMALAFLLEALITMYIPGEWIVGLLGHQNSMAVPLGALIGVPVYTSNLAALPMVSGLLNQGMNPAAGLAFLIAGPTTTLPAMAAVWGLTTRRVFILYLCFSLVGAVVAGYAYSLVSGLGM